MAQVTGTTDTFDIVGIKEDVEDIIYNITPSDTPLFTMAERGSADSTNHQWQTDELDTPGMNAQVEGDDATYATASPTVMISNRTVIPRKTLLVSRTADRVKKYGRAREMARLLVKRGKEIKLDIEYMLLGTQGSSAGSSSTARYMAGFGAMVKTNASILGGTGSTVPGYAGGDWGASVDGQTLATFTEDQLKKMLEDVWTAGGKSHVLMMNTGPKKAAAGFSGATKFAGNYVEGNRSSQGVLVAGVDLYISDYGEHRLRLNRHMSQNRVYSIDREHVKVAWLDRIRTEKLAKTGDAEKYMLIGELTLVLGNPDAHGQLVGVTG